MKNMLAIAAVFSLAMAACGGGAADAPAPQSPKADAPSANEVGTAGVKKPGEAVVGDKTTCPISKEVFTVTSSSPKAEYKGKTYYFCCGGCDAKFKSDPDKYLSSTATSSSPAP